MTIKNCIQTLVLVFAFVTLGWNASANPPISPASQAPATTKAPEVYNDGLMATIYTEDAKTGTWASPEPVGIPVGEFVDNKVPVFSFGNLRQDETAWAMYPGAHIGVEWTGYFHAEEAGKYVLMLDRIIKDEFYANSCIADLSLSGKSIVKNEFKSQGEDYKIDKSQSSKIFSITLEPGYYPLKLWLHCGVTEGRWNRWVDDADETAWTLKVKRPSDRMVKEVSKGMLVWQ